MRSAQVVGVGLLLSGIVGCGVNTDDGVDVKASALVVNQANVFGFEDVAHWSSTVALSSSTTHTQGSKALGVNAQNYIEVNSVALSSLTGVTSMLGLDVQLPTTQANPFWYGFVQLLISAPSKGLNNVYLGQQELT